MLTLKMLKQMPAGTIFASGVQYDIESGILMLGTGKPLRWVAVRGNMHDWTIYCYWEDKEIDVDWVRWHGDKVYSSIARRLVECDDEAFKMYRR